MDRIDDRQLTQADPALHSRYAAAVYPAWFADGSMIAHFAPPQAVSETGAAVLARLRSGTYDWRELLSALPTPTLVMHGERDALPPAVSADITYLLQHASRIVIPASGHMPFWEAPEVFFPAVEAFL